MVCGAAVDLQRTMSCLSKPHLICQDTVQAMRFQAHHPPQSLHVAGRIHKR